MQTSAFIRKDSDMTIIPRAAAHDELVNFRYFCEDLNTLLDCWFAYEPAENEYHETFSLYHVYLPESTIDIAPVLAQSVIEAIEIWVVDEADKARQDNADDAAMDAYENRRGTY